MNPNDGIREKILKFFYNRNAGATSKMGKKGSALKISDVKKELKDAHNFSQPQVMSNLTYLIDNGWIKTIDIEKTVTVRGGTIPQITTFYEVAAKGIDKIEGGSGFEPKDKYAGINITATGKNIITLGDGNIVNSQFSSLRAALDDLKAAVTESASMSESQKLNVAVDIESIKDQLAKPEPNKTVIGHLWTGLKAIDVIQGVHEAYIKVAPYIQALLT